MEIKTKKRDYVPGIVEDARRLGVSRQYLSLILHNRKRWENTAVMQAYIALKSGEAAGR